MKVALREVFWRDQWEVFLYREIGDHKEFMQPNGTLIPVQADVYTDDIKPMFSLNKNTAQNLIYELQKAGVRPLELTKVEGQYESQSAHLEDLRIILRTLGIMKKEA